MGMPLKRIRTDRQDGQQFLYTTTSSSSRLSQWWDTLLALKRYGPLSPYRTNQIVKTLLSRFSNLYDPVWLNKQSAATSIEDFAERVQLGREFTTRWGDEWALKAVGVGKKWMSEIMEGSTRVNVSTMMEES